ncbi:DUF3156 family protein [Providencia sp.]|uniref:DUF3156 family protein n=1 Tax=Providencia sp. TaxID=589 RepID=UPI003F9B97B9
MNHYAISPKYSFWQKIGLLGKKRLPIGYQAGLTLNKVERDVSSYQCEFALGGGALAVLLIKPQDELIIEVTERVKTLFMAFIVYSHFTVSGACDNTIEARINVKTTGSMRKKSIRYASKQVDGLAIIDLLNEYPIIQQTLEELDFNYCHIELKDGFWRCVIEPFTASEMVSRIPATRRYLRLTQQQRHRLLSALQLVSQLMRKRFPTY